MSNFMAIDQYGNTEHGLIHPRKDLKDRGYAGKVSKIYVDSKDGKIFHCGYVIGRHWFSIFRVESMRIPA
jgi:hypothetical protein